MPICTHIGVRLDAFAATPDGLPASVRPNHLRDRRR
jgi:hypothetical protein